MESGNRLVVAFLGVVLVFAVLILGLTALMARFVA
jgi:hypothetical protein